MARGYTTTNNGGGIKISATMPQLWGGWTQMAWVRVIDGSSGTGSSDAFGLRDTGAGAEYMLRFYTSGTQIELTYGGATTIDLFHTGMDQSIYHHYAATVSSPNSAAGPVVHGYVDGRLAGKTVFAGVTGSTITALVAAGAGSNFAIAGFVAYSRLWNRVLRQDEIMREKRSRFAVSRHRLIYDLPLHYDQTDTAGLGLWVNDGMVTGQGPRLGGFPKVAHSKISASLVTAASYAGPQPWTSVWRSARV